MNDARAVVAGAMGGFMEQRLVDFDERPARVSVFGQIHAATLKRGGAPVWVAVRDPNAEQRLNDELQEMELFFARLGRTNELRHVPWERLARELRASLRDGLDLRIQAHAMRELRKQVRRYPGASSPRVFQRLCGPEVLVAERVEGPSLEEVEARALDVGGPEAWFVEHGTDPEVLASRLWRSFMRQLVEARTLVPVQGMRDIVLLGDNRFCYRFEPFVLPLEMGVPRAEAFHFLLHALLRRSYEGAFFPLLRLAEPLPPLEPYHLKKVVSREVRAWAQRAEVETLPSETRSFGALFETVHTTMRRHSIIFDSAVLRACQELRRLEGALFTLDSHFRVASELRRFFKRSVRRAARRLTVQAQTPQAPDWEAMGQASFAAIESARSSAEQASRASLPFASESTLVAYVFSHAAGFVSTVFIVTVVLLVMLVARMTLDVPLSTDSWVERAVAAGGLPAVPVFVMGLVSSAVGAWGLRRLALRFAERDSHLPARRGL
ncbi:AarF/UbiB family protein [Myxococcus stipitatus]|nr:AarF/UbiB family protein [Myxococcus stipitatus]